jgi:hypothetical protein
MKIGMNIGAPEKRGALYFTLGLFAFTVFFLYLSYGYAPEVRLFPLMVGYTGLILCTLDLISLTDTGLGRIIDTVFSGKAAEEAGEDTGKVPKFTPKLSRQLTAMAWMVGLTIGIYIVGFMMMVPVYVFSSMFFQGKKSVKTCAYGAVCTTVFIWVMFEFLLKYELYRGIFAD